MRKIVIMFLAAAFLFSCNANDTTAVKGATDSTEKMEKPNLPFKVDKIPDWERGDPSHVTLAMNTLKAFVDNDMTGIQQYLADTVEFYTADIKFKGPKDSLVKMFTMFRGGLSRIDINMRDYESVKSKARGEEWVGMWYIENTVTKAGVNDSSMVMDDIKIVNGKVAIIDSKGRKLPSEYNKLPANTEMK
jgi:hypothetical protein